MSGYPITDAEILSTGRDAWDASLNTINVGKFNLGWASIGICSHAFYEAITHAAHRNLYGKYVTDFPHIQQLFTDAYTRLAAMKRFASRSVDYMRSASPEDRRYLGFNQGATKGLGKIRFHDFNKSDNSVDLPNIHDMLSRYIPRQAAPKPRWHDV